MRTIARLADHSNKWPMNFVETLSDLPCRPRVCLRFNSHQESRMLARRTSVAISTPREGPTVDLIRSGRKLTPFCVYIRDQESLYIRFRLSASLKKVPLWTNREQENAFRVDRVPKTLPLFGRAASIAS